MSKINPLKGEITEISDTLKQTEQVMKGFDKELKDMSKINPLKSETSSDNDLQKQ